MTTYRVSELAEHTGVKPQILRRLIEKGEIPAKRPPSGNWRIARSDLPAIREKLERYGLIAPAKTNAASKKKKAAKSA